jgi:hypothetical protein
MKDYTCIQCSSVFQSKKGCKSRTPKFCSNKCYAESMKLNIKCKLCEKVIENKHSVSIRNRKYCSKECQGKARQGIKLSENWRKALSEGRKKSEKCKGQNLYNWKGGKETQLLRIKSSLYKRKMRLTKVFPKAFLYKMLVAQKNMCFYCDNDLTEYKAIEHLTPVSKGGDNDIFNLVYSCKSCNSKKRQKTLEEFAIKTNRLFLLSKWEKLFIEAL